jgi:ligand-binding sensor domain-containing protein
MGDSEFVRKIQSDREGRVWVLTGGGQGPVVLDVKSVPLRVNSKEDLIYPIVNGVYQNREGQFWFATWGNGVTCYDPAVRIFRTAEGESIQESGLLTVDRDDTISFRAGQSHKRKTARLHRSSEGVAIEVLKSDDSQEAIFGSGLKYQSNP